MGTVLEVTDYSLSFDTPEGETQVVRNVGSALEEGGILMVVGESGCGKTMLCESLLRLLPKNAMVGNGQVTFCGRDITAYSQCHMRSLRGRQVSMVFQGLMATLNPTIPVGKQTTEATLKYQKIGKQATRARTLELLRRMEIDRPKKRLEMQLHLLSDEMHQRCVLAIALASHPKALVVDGSTTALDVAAQAKVLDLILSTCKESETVVLLISHDLSVVARIANRATVIYTGKIVEVSTAEEIFYDPRHPYT